MNKKRYIEPKMKVVVLPGNDILAGSFRTGDGTATQSLDDYDDTPSDDGPFRKSVIFD